MDVEKKICKGNKYGFKSDTSLIARWLRQVSHWPEMCFHDLEIMGLNFGQVEFGVCSTFV